MEDYDPDIEPDAAQWLDLDEQERIDLVAAYHLAAKLKLPNLTLHAAMHVVVENQIAEGLDAVVRALPRLMREGLSRHEAVHAIATVFTELSFDLLNASAAETDSASTTEARYCANIERLSAKEWLRQYGE